jgi:hypothetical protein
VVLAAVIADSLQLADTDLWMHIRFGQMFLQTGHLLRHDIFSYSAPGAPWFNHEWLADVVMALFYDAGGVAGLKVMKFLCATAIMTLLALGTAETGAEYLVQFFAVVLAALGLRLQVQFRPQLFDYILLSAMLAMLARDNHGRRAWLWLTFPMMALWANLHGGFFIGLGVLGLYTVVLAIEDRLAGRGWRRTIRLSAITSAAVLATLINPFGIQEWYVAIAKFSEPLVVMNRNLEFQSLLHQLAGGQIAICIVPLAIVAATAITFALTPRRDDLALLAIAALMICAWLGAMRNMAFAVIACTAPLARHSSLLIASIKRAPKMQPRAPVAVQMLVFAGAIFLVVSARIFSPSLPIYADYPVGAVAFMQHNHLSGNILSSYEWGGYLIWHEAPASKVFFDSFDERYPQTVQYDYLSLIAADSHAPLVLARYPHDYVLAPASSPLDLMLSKRTEWALIYRDPVCALYARAGSAALPKPISAPAPPSAFP